MKRTPIRILFLPILFLNLHGSVKGQTMDDWLFSINDSPTSVEEFEYVYRKNNSLNPEANSKNDIDDYLELFINFKLKVQEARKQGLDTTDSYKRELAQYERQLAEPYLTEKDVTEELIAEAYDRSLLEIDVSHILISVALDASPSDTLAAYEKAMKVFDLATSGQDFGELAIQYSNEPGINQTRGHLGYFTSMQMVYPFESAAYNLSPGQISIPVRTQYGYHVIKSNDKRPTNGRVQVSHIMKRFKPGMSGTDSIELVNKINAIRKAVLDGSDWLELCKEESEDFNTRNKGGVLPEFGVGEMLPQIAEPAFKLDSIGQISNPVMTSYGWHLLRLEGMKGPKSFDEVRPELERKVKRDSRSNKSKEALFKRLKDENAFEENTGLLHTISSSADSSFLLGNWNPNDNGGQSLFSIGGMQVTVLDFADWVNQNSNKSGPGTDQVRIERLYKLFVQERLIEYERAHLDEKHKDFKYLIQEYREGILLFEIMDKEVWSYSSMDSTGLADFFASNSQDYTMPKRANLIIFEASSETDQNRILEWLNDQSSNPEYIPMNELVDSLNQEFPDVYFETKLDSPVSELDEESASILKGSSLISGSKVTYVTSVEEARLAQLDEVKGLAISDYQNYLDSQWINALRRENNVIVNKKALKNVYKSLEN